MALRQRQSVQTKARLSTTLRSWLPILQSGLEELEEQLKAYEAENPYMEVRSGFETQFAASLSKRAAPSGEKSSRTEAIEALTLHESSLYERLHEQINAPLFPTPKSEEIAYAIVREISHEGYFEGDVEEIARLTGTTPEKVEAIRLRFAYLEPSGVGAKDAAEAMLFQLYQAEVEEPLYSLVERMLRNFDAIGSFKGEPLYDDAIAVIRRFKNPPALETMENSPEIVPDLVIVRNAQGIEVRINDDFYPDILIRDADIDHRFVKKKVREARDLIDALQMRKATLYKIGLMIVEFQYDFFQGGDIRPMKLKDIAEEFDHNPSTISRAIANKYLMCDRGIFPMKAFFTAGLDEEVSNASIKKFIAEAIAAEDRAKPLSDQKLLEMVEAKFGVKMVRRTITKYRKQMQIGGSSERKRFYQLA
ncbi:RNA polymerase factor sigma-54 [Hydrogenimonas sp.]